MLLIFSKAFVFGQEQKVTLVKDSIQFEDLLVSIEKQSNLNFFYAQEWIDSITINVQYNQESVSKILEDQCAAQNISYIFLPNNKVILSKNYQIRTNYNLGYKEYLSTKKLLASEIEPFKLPVKPKKEENKINDEYRLHKIGNPSIDPGKKKAILSGSIKDAETGEGIIGAVVYIDELKLGSASNQYGYYNITIPKGQYKVEYRSVGMKTSHRNIVIHSDGKLDVDLNSEPQSLSEVLVTQKKDDQVRSLNMGMEKLSMKALKQLPLGLGEADIIKSTLLLPGVQSVGEASSGFNVRGGSVDQNLILLNDAPIMNTSHFFGFFSGFNSEVVKDITLYKSGVPAKYGGRVSSVMDITMKEGNQKKTKLTGGISPVSGRLVLEGPLLKDKISYIIGYRQTYSDWVLNLLDDRNLQQSKASFYDLQGNLSYDVNENNSIYLSGYKSHDDFDYYSQDAFSYNTLATTAKWKHIFSPKLFSTFSAGVSNYDYSLTSRADSASKNKVDYLLQQYSVKADLSYHPNAIHKIDYGFNAKWYQLEPGLRTPIGTQSVILPKTIEHEQALETAIYISDEFDLNQLISLSAGIRLNLYNNWGPKNQFNYAPNVPRSEEAITDTSYFSGGPINTYFAPDFRFSTNIKTGLNSSVKIGVTRMHQFIHMISNTSSMSPTDIWKLSDKYLKPQRGDQFSLGYYQNLKNGAYEASVEGYYKNLKNVLDYKGGAQLIMNDHLETDVLNGDGKAYGIEFMLEKKQGRLTGWANYTYSRVLHRIQGTFAEEMVNNGEYFPANYDKPHELKLVANYKFSRRLNLSSNLFYSTGRPFTAPVAYYFYEDSYRIFYSTRNSLRMEDYIRLDFAATINGNLKKSKLNHSSWTFAVFNALGRRNPYSVFFKTEGEKVKGYKMSIFGQPIFTVTYNFKLFGNAKDDF